MSKETLIEEIKKARVITKDFKKLKHLFSDDEGTKTLAELNRALSRIEFHLRIQELKEIAHPENEVIQKPIFGKSGSLVSVSPCAEKYGNKTYLGFLIGEIALGSSITISENKIQCNWSGHNPAIFVPELSEIIYGCGSWWQAIESEDDLKQITDFDIENVWYVKLLKKQFEKTKK